MLLVTTFFFCKYEPTSNPLSTFNYYSSFLLFYFFLLFLYTLLNFVYDFIQFFISDNRKLRVVLELRSKNRCLDSVILYFIVYFNVNILLY